MLRHALLMVGVVYGGTTTVTALRPSRKGWGLSNLGPRLPQCYAAARLADEGKGRAHCVLGYVSADEMLNGSREGSRRPYGRPGGPRTLAGLYAPHMSVLSAVCMQNNSHARATLCKKPKTLL